LAGQCPVRPDGTYPPADDLQGQLDQTVANCLAVLAAVEADPSDVVRSTVYVVADSQRELAQVWALLVDPLLARRFRLRARCLALLSWGIRCSGSR
jgi:enamine deaminase RidA (YjgF/YER057c/UK114 family)